MKCHDCRKHLHPYLDNELAVKDNLAILEHLNACGPCQSLFLGEERCWAHFRQVLQRDVPPPSTVSGIPELLLREDHSRWWRKALLGFAPVAAAAAVVVFAVLYDPTPSPTPPTPDFSRQTHWPRDHGPGIEFAVGRFVALEEEAASGKVPVLDPVLLARHSESFDILVGPEKIRCFFDRLFGEGAKAPREVCGPDVRAAGLRMDFNGQCIENLILDFSERRIGVYHLSRDAARMMDLHLLENDTRTGLKIERCRGCHVIAVTRNDSVYILVSLQGVEPMLELIRETF